MVLMASILDLSTDSGQDQDTYEFEVCGVCMEAIYICVCAYGLKNWRSGVEHTCKWTEPKTAPDTKGAKVFHHDKSSHNGNIWLLHHSSGDQERSPNMHRQFFPFGNYGESCHSHFSLNFLSELIFILLFLIALLIHLEMQLPLFSFQSFELYISQFTLKKVEAGASDHPTLQHYNLQGRLCQNCKTFIVLPFIH